MKLFLLSALCAGLLTMTACQKKAEQQVETTYTVTTPLVDSIDLPKDYAANINSLRNVEIRSQQKGLLQTVYVSEGQYVKADNRSFALLPWAWTRKLPKLRRRWNRRGLIWKMCRNWQTTRWYRSMRSAWQWLNCAARRRTIDWQ